MSTDRSATLDLIRRRLAPLAGDGKRFACAIEDDSHRHAGHAGAREGGHFRLTVVSDSFRGVSTLQRHRLVLDLLGDLRAAGIHALSIVAQVPNEPAGPTEPAKSNPL